MAMMKLFVCGSVDHTLMVEVDPQVNTVADLKLLISKQLRPSSESEPSSTSPPGGEKCLTLFHDEQQLSDSTVLSTVPNLKDGATVIAIESTLLHLYIEDVARKITKPITITDPMVASFSRLTKLVTAVTGVGASQQKLFYSGSPVKSLHGIPDGSTLTLFSVSTWTLIVKYCEPGAEVVFPLTIPNPQSTSILFLKKLIEKKTDLLPRQQHLVSSYYIDKQDDCPLSETKMTDGSTVVVSRISGWHLHIKMVDGSSTMVTVDNPEDMTVTELRGIILKATSIPEDEQRLLTSDHVILEDFWVDLRKCVSRKHLKSYPQISDESVLHLVRLTRRMMKIVPYYLHLHHSQYFYVDIPKEACTVGDLSKALEKQNLLLKCGEPGYLYQYDYYNRRNIYYPNSSSIVPTNQYIAMLQ